jgi:hypothetical protein
MFTVAGAEPPGAMSPNDKEVEAQVKGPLNVWIVHVIDEALVSTTTPRRYVGETGGKVIGELFAILNCIWFMPVGVTGILS